MPLASVFAFLGRDSLVGTGFGIFAGTWLAYSLAGLSGPPGRISHLMFVVVAGYVGMATLMEDAAHRTLLPVGRRGPARAAFAEGLDAQLDELEHEAGVRGQL